MTAVVHPSPPVPRDWIGRPPPVLSGHGVTLRPLAEPDLAPLFALTPPETFRFYSIPPKTSSVDAFVTHMVGLLSDPTRLHMAVVHDESKQVIGSTSYLDIRPEHKALEVGFTWYAPAFRGTRINPACKRLMIGHAIDTLGAVRVQIKTDRRNHHSQRAIEKLGATYEGVLRNSFIQPDGHLRDTVYYSVLPSEWPRVRAGLDARLRIHAT